jgi:hypothetical protein
MTHITTSQTGCKSGVNSTPACEVQVVDLLPPTHNRRVLVKILDENLQYFLIAVVSSVFIS